MKHNQRVNNSGIFLLILIMFLGIDVCFSQSKEQLKSFNDNPNIDQLPKWYIDQVQGANKAPSQVITINDYDNFYLGVDFAESHISENPLVPGQYFAAFNIDGTHRTMNGHDWTDATQVSWAATARGDVLTAFDSQGNLYYENMYGSFSIQGCKLARSTDNGLNWSSAVTAISGGDKNWLAADQTGGPYSNYIYTTMTNTSYNGGNFARSTDFGATWTTTETFTSQSLPGMMVCVGPNGSIDGGSVYVVTNSGDSFASTYTFYESNDGGLNFSYRSAQNFAGYVGTASNGRNSVENMRTRPYPFIAADNSDGPYRGRLYLVYTTNWPSGNGNKPDIFCRYSDNDGITWSSGVKVNDDLNTQNHHQWSPAIWCDITTGRLYVQWMDTRDTPTSDSALIYASYSDNGGQSFVTNQQISNEKMIIDCLTCGGGGSPRYQGDYNGIVSNPNTSMAVWADFRWGTFASFVGYFPDYAMRLTSTKDAEGVNTIYAEVPDVKLYTEDVIFTATMETPPSGSFSISYPSGNTLSSFPGSIPIQITDNNVPSGNYTCTVKGEGPNGTPVHYREIPVSVVAPQPPVVEFTADEVNPFVGDPVNFTDLSTNAPDSWNWTFNPSTVTFLGGTSSSSQNPQVSFDAAGNYSVTLTAGNIYGNDSETKFNYISAVSCTYCAAAASNATEEWISNVTFNTINNSINTTAGYEDFTNISTDVDAGATYNASVSVGSTGNWTEHYWIFIDWNANCDFSDANESYDMGQANGTNTLNINVTVPSAVSAGGKRMRVIIMYDDDPGPCESFTWGQVEDYTVNVLPAGVILDVKAFLEGPFNGTDMETGLTGDIPLNQPFNMSPWNYPGSENVSTIPTGTVDWVLVELRDASSPAGATGATSIARRAGFIMNSGAVVDIDGTSNIEFLVTPTQGLYVVLWQRNHLGVLSNFALPFSGGVYSYDFTSGINQVYGGANGHKEITPGIWGMIGGDASRDGNVDGSDLSPYWELETGMPGYLESDFTLDGQSDNKDKNDIWVPNEGKGTSVPN